MTELVAKHLPLFASGTLDPDTLGEHGHAGEPLRVIDLFAGAGGLSEGFQQEGFAVVACSDVDTDACATYASNFPDAQSICRDIREPGIDDQGVSAGLGVDDCLGGTDCQARTQVVS